MERLAPAGTIGTDESGKGDYFGPLVVAGVYVPDGGREVLAALGVRDSKTLSDGQVERLARAVREAYPTAVVAIGPERYNALYAKVGNLNRLLAWAHARSSASRSVARRSPTSSGTRASSSAPSSSAAAGSA